MDEKREEIKVERNKGETLQNYEERFKNQQEMWKCYKYIESKNKCSEWNELEIKTENNTDKFQEGMQTLDKCAIIEENKKDITRHTRWKMTKTKKEKRKPLSACKKAIKFMQERRKNLNHGQSLSKI